MRYDTWMCHLRISCGKGQIYVFEDEEASKQGRFAEKTGGFICLYRSGLHVTVLFLDESEAAAQH